jgi:hypothetical protein
MISRILVRCSSIALANCAGARKRTSMPAARSRAFDFRRTAYGSDVFRDPVANGG